MTIQFTRSAMKDLEYWQKHSPDKVHKIKSLLANIIETPFTGLGKPEPLLLDLSGYWSRRIDKEHRLVYQVSDSGILVISCRYHY